MSLTAYVFIGALVVALIAIFVTKRSWVGYLITMGGGNIAYYIQQVNENGYVNDWQHLGHAYFTAIFFGATLAAHFLWRVLNLGKG